jgi:hypothetical protein
MSRLYSGFEHAKEFWNASIVLCEATLGFPAPAQGAQTTLAVFG